MSGNPNGLRSNMYLPTESHTLPPRYSSYGEGIYGSEVGTSSEKRKGLPRMDDDRMDDVNQRGGGRYNHPVDYDHEQIKEPKTFQGVLSRFADNTSLMGIPFIHIARRCHTKLIWLVIFFGCVAGCAVHTYFIVSEYIQFNTSSSVNITYSSVDFPSVTICNVNPLRASLVGEYGTEDLHRFFESLKPQADYNDEYKDFERPDDYGDDSLNDFTKRKKRAVNSGNDTQTTGTTSTPRQSKGRPQDDDYTEYDDVGVIGTVNPEDWEYLTPDGDEGLGVDDVAGGYLVKSIYENLMSEIPKANRTSMGHQRRTMVLSCSYNGLKCQLKNFSSIVNIDYGNCYTFNSAVKTDSAFRASRSGKTNGLELFLFAEHYEYLEGFSHELGFYVTIHPFNTIPFVSENSIALPTGSATYVGMRTLQQTRLGGRYGACGDDGQFLKQYGKNYTIDSCVNTCLDRTIAEACGCYRSIYLEYYPREFTKNNRRCNMSSTKDTQCIQRQIKINNAGNLSCTCNPACQSESYNYHISTNKWPDTSMWYTLVDTVCARDDWGCYYLQSHEDNKEEILRSNFAKLTVYYRDLNVEQVKEQPAYADEQFWSDFGGCLGLGIGVSVLTIFECIDLLVSCCTYCCKRGEYKRRKEALKSTQAMTRR